jgi:DMSO reductase family type II enzyme chaperone
MSAPTNMPTPSEPTRPADCAIGNEARAVSPEEWAARPRQPARSVFGNFRPHEQRPLPATVGKPVEPGNQTAAGLPGGAGSTRADSAIASGGGLQAAIDLAPARCFLYRFLAKAYEDPTQAGWQSLCAQEFQKSFRAAILVIGAAVPGFIETARLWQAQLYPDGFEAFFNACLAAFGHAARGRCPLNEIEYGDIKADPLFQPHRLADLAAFYRAFGLEMGDDADERPDHICVELEFMCVLAAKEAYALEHQFDPEDLAVCRDAQKKFLRLHLGRWTPAFTRHLARMAGESSLGTLANLTRSFVEGECARFGTVPGSEDLLLRPVDEAAESLCTSCGLTQLPPGAQPAIEPS